MANICRKCGAKAAEAARFCVMCGERLEKPGSFDIKGNDICMAAVNLLKQNGCQVSEDYAAGIVSEESRILAEDAGALTPELISKLFQVTEFIKVLGCSLHWKDLSELLGKPLVEITEIEVIELLRMVVETKLYIKLPFVEKTAPLGDTIAETSELRRGEMLLLKMDYDRAIEWYKQFIESNGDKSGFAYNVLGQLFIRRQEKTERESVSDYKEAEAWLNKADEYNNVLGQINRGRMYEKGMGTHVNTTEALRYYLRAFQQGNEFAYENMNRFLYTHLIEIYENGCRIENVSDFDYRELADCCEDESKHNHGLAIINTGYMYHHGLGREKSLTTARDYYNKAIELNKQRALALNLLGDLYWEGCDAIPQNYNAALEYWNQAIQKDHGLASFGLSRAYKYASLSLGQAHNYGWGVPEDIRTAIEYYKKSGNAASWFALGKLMETGNGEYNRQVFGEFVSSSDAEYECYKKSAEEGSLNGRCWYALRLYNGSQSQGKDPSKAFTLMTQAAELGHPKSVFALGLFYETGIGCDANRYQALQCFQRAAQNGDEEAKEKLKSFGTESAVSNVSFDDAYKMLQSLIGLESVKKEVDEIINEAKIIKEMREKDLPDSRGACHMVFTGNPGTGKTEVARLIGAIFKGYGVLSQGQLIEVDRSELVASYVGQTTSKTQDVINRAIGGILFIDEAYTLHKESESDFGQEAIDTILKEMEDHRDDLIVIVAGYEKPMYEFLHSNPGLESRFRRSIHFEDYNAEELMQIFKKFCSDNENIVSEAVENKAFQKIKKLVAFKTDTFGNAREIRKLYEDTIRNQRNRLAKDEADHTKEELLTIQMADLPQDSDDAVLDVNKIMEELDSMIGLEAVKEEIGDLANLIEIQADRRDMGLESSLPSLHMVFTGNPGTGKTTVARIVSKIYQALGVLSKGTLTEASRADLVAGYTGQTALKTKDIIAKSLGGVLFIDEAYSLVQGEGDSFGQEAIDTLLKEMEDHRNNLAVIVAGYSDEMQVFLSANAGLASRFNRYIDFADYSTDQLLQIFEGRCESEHYRATEKLLCELKSYLNTVNMREFANGRGIRNLFEKILSQQAKRLQADKRSGKQLTKEDYLILTERDLEEVLGK